MCQRNVGTNVQIEGIMKEYNDIILLSQTSLSYRNRVDRITIWQPSGTEEYVNISCVAGAPEVEMSELKTECKNEV